MYSNCRVFARFLTIIIAVSALFVFTERNTFAAENSNKKQIVTYFGGFHLSDGGPEVAAIPWDKVTRINHAFWKPATSEAATPGVARTSFSVVSLAPEADFASETSEIDASLSKGHFYQYEKYSEKYPDVEILISIGGYTG